MCEACGCNLPLPEPRRRDRHVHRGAPTVRRAAVSVMQDLLSENDHQAAHNRQHLDAARVLAVNLMSSPGSGKTALLEATVDGLREELKIAVIEGDLETEHDAARLRQHGVPAVQITTGSACHLDAHMVHDALHELDLEGIDVLFVENVGNLVCPASFDLGHHLNVTLLSTTEGDDKPAKYPVMFRASDLMLISKADLLAILGDFDPAQAEEHLRTVGSQAPVIPVSARGTPEIGAWLQWLRQHLQQHRRRLDAGLTTRPNLQRGGRHFHEASQSALRESPTTAEQNPRGRLMMASARVWLQRIRELPRSSPVRIMNVCGGHERSISLAGLRRALPAQIELIPGPGCPVCVCPEEDIYQAIQLALHERVTLVAFGDMLRVPCNAAKGSARSLEQARAAGADVRPIASPQQAVEIARSRPGQPVVFFAAGFETTSAPVAAMLAEGIPENLYVLLSGRLTWPAVAMLLASEAPGFDALVAPGHVATVMGPEEWQFVVDRHAIPAAIAGFTPDSLLAALYSVLRQHLEGRPFLDNCYASVVRRGGNAGARAVLARVTQIVDATWRGIGVIPGSGFALRDEHLAHDARRQFPGYENEARKRAGQMPPGCDCARVVLGKIYPNQCVLYGRACTPQSPSGPCMVSDEGACRIWWASGVRESEHHRPPEQHSI